MATTTLAPRARPYTSTRARAYEWLTTTDHKKIGVMYMASAFLFFLIGGVYALLIRAELAVPGIQFLEFETYNQLFTLHGTVMIFLFVMPMWTGLANYIVPLQVGAADMAFPRINALSYWMIPVAGLMLFSGYAFGGAANAGWTGYAPLSVRENIGIDLWVGSLVLLGTSSILGAINFIATIFKMRAPGLTLMRMPLFVWNTLVTSVLLLFAVPVLTAGFVMLFIDRNYGGGFFDPALGGNPILWQHIFWFFGHPEVYILILPAFGVVSEILPVFSRKPLFGYKAFVFATASIGALGFSVWAHHMFATGAVYLPFFSFFTFLIAVPTGIKFFNWLATMWGGQLRLSTPMLFAIGFIALFLIGGLDGAFLAVVPFDFHVHDTYWVVSHIHYVLVAGAVFGIFAALYYWWPKITGRMLDERLGKVQWVLLFVGTNVAFFPQHILGLDGMIRRIIDYAPNPGWTELNFLSTIGAFMVGISMLPFMWNVFITQRKPATAGDDPWDANTLEWATTSPPPTYNFEALPPVRSERPLFDLKYGAVEPHAAAVPAARGESHEETRADAPEEFLGEPVEGHEDPDVPGARTTPQVSEHAPDATPREERPKREGGDPAPPTEGRS
ncbi:MAG TPA: cytochrome c oxidase subunit I [Candidatus Limnocylindrales bacterium]|nr:cytochrome c oxidase subunit I [Candidatus Limnocylindrales bacterium]